MSIKKSEKIIYSIGIIILLAWFVSAAAGDTILIVSPANFTNNSGSVFFNVSFVNGTDIIDPVNATFYANVSGAWTLIGNTSATGGCDVGATTASSCAVTLVTSEAIITSGVYAINATLWNASSAVGYSILPSVNLANPVIIDNTAPQVQAANFSGVASGTNHSGTVYLNVSVVEPLVTIDTVFFNVTNATSGLQNATYTGVLETGSNYYSVQINTSHFDDGQYNITVYANDSLNNLNDTATAHLVWFDNTMPSPSVSCSPSSVNVGASFPCTCSGDDSGGSGVETASGSSTSPDGTGTPANTGVFTYTCSVTDYSGNSNANTAQYTVTGSGGDSGGSSGGGSGPSLAPSDDSEGATTDDGGTDDTEDSSSTTGESDADGLGGASGSGLGTTGNVVLVIVILAALGGAVVYFLKKRK